MRKALRWLAVAGIAAGLPAATIGCAVRTVEVTDGDAGSVQTARVGDRIVVLLAGNPSTGFAWSRVEPDGDAMDGSALAPIDEGVWEVPTGGDVPGTPGLCRFEYSAEKPGAVTLAYAYARPWEEETAQTFTVTIWVRE